MAGEKQASSFLAWSRLRVRPALLMNQLQFYLGVSNSPVLLRAICTANLSFNPGRSQLPPCALFRHDLCCCSLRPWFPCNLKFEASHRTKPSIMLFFFPGDYFPGSQYCIFFSMCFTSEVPSCCFQRRMESFCLVSSSSLEVFRGCPSEDQKLRCLQA